MIYSKLLTLWLKMCHICTSPNTPKAGYKVLTKFEKPMLETNIADEHINIFKYLYAFLVFVQFFKKLYPIDIAEVKIAAIITIP